jgi:23S rRNA (cytosine1962-C5)-methyltransferase
MDTTTASLRVFKGREKPINNRHPWIFSGAIHDIVRGDPQPGDLVEIVDENDRWLAQAYYNPHSQIRARILSWDPEERIDEEFWHNKVQRAVRRRQAINIEDRGTTALRLIFAESDGLPGLIVDQYEDYLVVQYLTLGVDIRKSLLTRVLEETLKPRGILERSDVNVRKMEGLKKVVGLLAGTGPPESLTIHENNKIMLADLYRGHKTGLYLDQRKNRQVVCQQPYVEGREILNVFAYTGGFSLYAAANKAQKITNVEASEAFLGNIEENLKLNEMDRPQDEYISGDAFRILRDFREEGRQFDAIILDPPKFANRKQDIPSACRGYKDINLLALQLLRPLGLLTTFSCSGLISEDLFQKVLFGAAIDAGRDVQIIQRLGQAEDHPILVTFPESAYLKGFLCQVL